jgi:hypothetical protein
VGLAEILGFLSLDASLSIFLIREKYELLSFFGLEAVLPKTLPLQKLHEVRGVRVLSIVPDR